MLLQRREFLKKTFEKMLGLSALGISSYYAGSANAVELDAGSIAMIQQGHPMYDTVRAVFGEYELMERAQKVSLSLPEKIDYPSIVTIKLEAFKREDINAMAIIIDNNNEPVVSVIELSKGADAYLTIRARVEKSSVVRAIVKTDKGLEEISAMVNLNTF